MKTLLLMTAAILLTAPALAGTHKAVWNQPIDSPANVAAKARVTAALPTICAGIGECRFERGPGEARTGLLDKLEDEPVIETGK